MIFFWGGAQPLHHTPFSSTPTASPPPYWNPKYATDCVANCSCSCSLSSVGIIQIERCMASRVHTRRITRTRPVVSMCDEPHNFLTLTLTRSSAVAERPRDVSPSHWIFHSRSLNVIGNDILEQCVCKSVLVFHCKCIYISYRFWVF